MLTDFFRWHCNIGKKNPPPNANSAYGLATCPTNISTTRSHFWELFAAFEAHRSQDAGQRSSF